MLSQMVVNLLIPGDPQKLTLNLPSTKWNLDQVPEYADRKQAMAGFQCAETYTLSSSVSNIGSPAFNAAFEDLTPIFLACSYATGLTVTSRHSGPGSEVLMIQGSEHWPRDRAMDAPSYVFSSSSEFVDLVERFVVAWPTAGKTEKARLLIHHWLDAIVCWSMEDLYLSATTLLQVIVATEAGKQGKQELRFYDGVEAAAQRYGLNVLSSNFKNMRNELVHDGQLIGRRFAGPDKFACANVIVEVLNWLDNYMHAALSLGAVRKQRFKPSDLYNLNAYSIG
ncbi:hypothetical protein [Methylobacterium sp. V23]|uniref:hypothetical protein n=1 Tax=Methylobacterium sp. V23 TaxID=2044878 RepID=UPI0011B07F21|nr:hypothetical protein [Methylobacterium sp. V23]